MRHLRRALALVSSLALSGAVACSPEAEAPTPPVQPSPAPAGPLPAPLDYACQGGQAIKVAYVDTATAQLTWKGKAYTLRAAQSASGARYLGSGLEWRTAAGDGEETATLSRLSADQQVAVAVLERCRRPSTGSVADGPAPEVDPVQPISAPCRGPQLQLSLDGGDAGAGNRVTVLGVQNIGAQPCSLTGYPDIVLQDVQGRDLAGIRSEQTTASYFRQSPAPAAVNLPPRAKAWFDIAWSAVPKEGQGERTCPSAARIRMTAPGDTAGISLDQAFAPCGGRIRVSPFRAAAAPAPTPSAPSAT